MIQDLKLKVRGERTIHCSGCERTIERTLARRPGVTRVKADQQTQLIELVLDTDVINREQVNKELEWIGYQVEEVKQ
ncbi:MAG: heavy-metal-associated domain-containing protein [Chloroflexi bacterium]|nr:heavy-metal-associated domain-containing protein [Chloroflexota bacterium]